MKPLEIIKNAQNTKLTNEDGDVVNLEMMPGLLEREIQEFARQLPCGLSSEIRELLSYCRGFFGAAAEPVDFTGRSCSFEMLEVFPHGLPIAADGYGNFWVADLWPDSTDFAPIYFTCHDAPVSCYKVPLLSTSLPSSSKCQCHRTRVSLTTFTMIDYLMFGARILLCARTMIA